MKKWEPLKMEWLVQVGITQNGRNGCQIEGPNSPITLSTPHHNYRKQHLIQEHSKTEGEQVISLKHLGEVMDI